MPFKLIYAVGTGVLSLIVLTISFFYVKNLIRFRGTFIFLLFNTLYESLPFLENSVGANVDRVEPSLVFKFLEKLVGVVRTAHGKLN